MCFIKLILGNECIVPGFLDERAMGARTHDWKSIDLSFRLFFLGGKIVTGVIDLPMKFWGNGDWEWEFMGNGKHSTIPWPFHSVGPTLRSYPRTIFCLLTTCEQAHYVSPHELVASSMAGKSARENQRRCGQSRDIKTGQATHLWHPDSAVGELGSDASLPSSACIAFSRLKPFHKTGTDFDKLSKLVYLGVSLFCTRSLWYLNLKISPTECIRECHPPNDKDHC